MDHEETHSIEGTRVNMLSGGLFGKIIRFALPLAASSILQQLFNSADTAVVGRFAGSQAMAAVGANSPVINLIVSLFVGLSVGANVLVASLIGKKLKRDISTAVHTVICISLISGVFLLFLSLAVSRPVLELINTPTDVIEQAVLYLRIYSLGMPFIMMFNFSSAILQSMGNSRRPLAALVTAGIVNVALNLLLVIVFGLGVAGVAIATVISNVISSGMLLYTLIHEPDPFHLDLKKLRIDKSDLIRILRIGVPAGLQGMVFTLSNTIIQSALNGFGSSAVAGSTAALNYEFIIYYAINAFNSATVTFTSQNYAAGQYDRCKKIFRITFFSALLSSICLEILFLAGRQFCLGLFSTDPTVIHYASLRFWNILLFEALAVTYEIPGSAMRGMGYSMLPAVLTILGTCVIRILWIYFIFPLFGTFEFLMYVYPASWILTGAMVSTAYFIMRRKCFREITPVPETVKTPN